VKSIVSGLNSGANDYLVKPYKIAELEARIGVGLRMLDLQAELNKAREALAYEATHDSLTGALNRRPIYEVLSHEFSRARRKTSSFSICLCDIDFFKQINDKHGHLAGDDVLKGLVRTLQSNIRDYDMVGRYGGEEFLVIAPNPHEVQDNLLFERLRSVVADAKFPTQTGNISVTISAGVARFREETSIDELIAVADEALYGAKAGGRNRVVHAVGK
jgi:two-component system, cell cycle response regulator